MSSKRKQHKKEIYVRELKEEQELNDEAENKA